MGVLQLPFTPSSLCIQPADARSDRGSAERAVFVQFRYHPGLAPNTCQLPGCRALGAQLGQLQQLRLHIARVRVVLSHLIHFSRPEFSDQT